MTCSRTWSSVPYKAHPAQSGAPRHGARCFFAPFHHQRTQAAGTFFRGWQGPAEPCCAQRGETERPSVQPAAGFCRAHVAATKRRAVMAGTGCFCRVSAVLSLRKRGRAAPGAGVALPGNATGELQRVPVLTAQAAVRNVAGGVFWRLRHNLRIGVGQGHGFGWGLMCLWASVTLRRQGMPAREGRAGRRTAEAQKQSPARCHSREAVCAACWRRRIGVEPTSDLSA